MTGATSPRLHLELMVARILVPASDETERGALARVERLERRVGVAGVPSAGTAPSAARPVAQPVSTGSTTGRPAEKPVAQPVSTSSTTGAAQPVSTGSTTGAAQPVSTSSITEAAQTTANTTESAPVVVEEAIVEEIKSGAITPPAAPPVVVPEPAPEIKPAAATPVTLQQVRDAWPEILKIVEDEKRSAWIVLQTAQARALNGDVLTVTFPSEVDVANFKQPDPAGDGVSEYLRKAIVAVLGLRVKYIARVEAPAAPAAAAPAASEAEAPPEDAPEPGGWAVASIPQSEPAPPTPEERAAARKVPVAAAPTDQRYGESVVRELLKASFIEEQPLAPRVVPTPRDE
jgi:DNA polymerase-3 subunit gamma/tau